MNSSGKVLILGASGGIGGEVARGWTARKVRYHSQGIEVFIQICIAAQWWYAISFDMSRR
ncbi:hypothetical protein C7D74_26035 [Klebsiella pneumoniae]|nr:hypothetical protein C7D74_26035 [Klebsiella pneumoniae]